MANARTKVATNIVSLDTNFNRKYAFYNDAPNPILTRLEEILCEETLFDNLQYMFQKSSELINSIRLYPFNIIDFAIPEDATAIVRTIPIGRINGDATRLTGRALKGVINNKLVATLNVSKAQYFYQFEPHSEMKIYLPYLGYYNLPVNEIRDADTTLQVLYSVDFDTGMLTAYVKHVQKDYILLTATGKIGVDIPIGATNVNEVATNILSSSLKIVGGLGLAIATGGSGSVPGAIMTSSGLKSAFNGAIDLATHSVTHYTNGGLNGGSSTIASPNMCFIEYIEPIVADYQSDRQFAHLYGKPLHEIRNLGNVTGFTKVSEIHVEDLVDATEPEIREIENLLKSGVIL